MFKFFSAFELKNSWRRTLLEAELLLNWFLSAQSFKLGLFLISHCGHLWASRYLSIENEAFISLSHSPMQRKSELLSFLRLDPSKRRSKISKNFRQNIFFSSKKLPGGVFLLKYLQYLGKHVDLVVPNPIDYS